MAVASKNVIFWNVKLCGFIANPQEISVTRRPYLLRGLPSGAPAARLLCIVLSAHCEQFLNLEANPLTFG
jgi:hypothetical protein